MKVVKNRLFLSCHIEEIENGWIVSTTRDAKEIQKEYYSDKDSAFAMVGAYFIEGLEIESPEERRLKAQAFEDEKTSKV